jgi:NAD(P)H dehydrogenase (quinone)
MARFRWTTVDAGRRDGARCAAPPHTMPPHIHEQGDMPKILVLFYSRTGTTAALADAIADGAKRVKFSEVDVRRIEDLAPESVVSSAAGRAESRERLRRTYKTFGDVASLADYDGIVLGSPTRHGVMAAELTHVLDQTGPLWSKGLLVDKVGAAFTPVQTPHGGHETTLWSIMTAMATLGMIIVPPGSADPAAFAAAFAAGSASGAASGGAGAPTEEELAAARAHGKRVATVVEWIAHAKSHGHGHSPGHSPGHSH